MFQFKERVHASEEDIEKILIVGAGPIVIGQACELIILVFKLVKLSSKRVIKLFS